MKEQALPSQFFVELDAILDTRLGTILRINPDASKQILEGGYLVRDRDLFTGIDPEQFKEMYAKRDRLTLKASLMTPMLNMVRDYCKDTLEGNVKTPFLREPSVVINHYPYELTESEKEMMLEFLKKRIGEFIPVQFVSMSLEEITPSFLKQKTSIIALYDPFEWLETHARSGLLKKQTCPEVLMFGALLFRNLTMKGYNIKELQKHHELMAKPFIDFNLIAAHVYSAHLGNVGDYSESKPA